MNSVQLKPLAVTFFSLWCHYIFLFFLVHGHGDHFAEKGSAKVSITFYRPYHTKAMPGGGGRGAATGSGTQKACIAGIAPAADHAVGSRGRAGGVCRGCARVRGAVPVPAPLIHVAVHVV